MKKTLIKTLLAAPLLVLSATSTRIVSNFVQYDESGALT